MPYAVEENLRGMNKVRKNDRMKDRVSGFLLDGQQNTLISSFVLKEISDSTDNPKIRITSMPKPEIK